MIEIEREKIGGGNERGEKRKRNGSDLFRKANRFLETGDEGGREGGGGGRGGRGRGSVVDLVFGGRRGGKCFGTGRNKCS